MAVAGHVALAQRLRSEGIDTIFGVMGEGNLNLIAHWVHDLGCDYVAARHEAGAVSMATGYAQVSQHIGVCTVTHGPGLANALTALRTASNARLPVLLVAGALPAETRDHHAQFIDQRKVVESAGADFIEVDSIYTAYDAVEEALRRLTNRTNSVVLNLPVDMQVREWVGENKTEAPSRQQQPVAVRPDRQALAAAADSLVSSSRPAILVGRGAFLSGAVQAVADLADHLGAPLATSLLGKGMFRGHPLDVGVSGGFSWPHAQTTLGESDCVLAVGTSLNHWTTLEGVMFPNAAVIACDIDIDAIGAQWPVAQSLLGDARATCEDLLTVVEELSPPQTERRSRMVDRLAVARDELQAERRAASGGQRAMSEINDLLPEERTVVVDGGHFMGYACMDLEVPDPRGFVWTSMFGSIGLGLATAVGAAFGDPDRITVAVVGDGGLMMNWGELDTAVRHRLPLVIIAMNDGAYGAEVHFLRHQGLPGDVAEFATPDLADIARGFGAESHTVRNPSSDFQELKSVLQDPSGPVLVDVILDTDEVAPWFRSHLDSGA